MSADHFKQARLLDLVHAGTASGVQWSAETDDLDCNFVSWEGGEVIAAHVNAEVDVFIVILSGGGRLSVNEAWTELLPGTASLVPKNASRSIAAGDNGIAYITVHKRRRRLMPGDAQTRTVAQRSLKEKTSS